jgi:hypothetical protein
MGLELYSELFALAAPSRQMEQEAESRMAMARASGTFPAAGVPRLLLITFDYL